MQQTILFFLMFLLANTASAMKPSLRQDGPEIIKTKYPNTIRWFEEHETNSREFSFENNLVTLLFNQETLAISTSMGSLAINTVIFGSSQIYIMSPDTISDTKYQEACAVFDRILNSLEKTNPSSDSNER